MAGLAMILLAAAGAPAPPPRTPYLERPALVAAASQLPPPPPPGSATDRADRLHYETVTLALPDRTVQRARKLINMARPPYRQALSCALGAQIDPRLTPALAAILARADIDAAQAAGAVKFNGAPPRLRPNNDDGSPACDGRLATARPGSSYPSRHAASAYLWALILAELRPDRRADLIEFGTETGDLWVACRINWRSDAEQGRVLGQAVFRQLMQSRDFRTDLARAREALATAPPPFSC